MSSEVQAFFNTWIKHELPARMCMTDALPGPLSMFAVLCSDALAEGITEADLCATLIDPFEALLRAMMETPGPGHLLRPGTEPDQPANDVTPGEAMRLAISYLDGFRDFVDGDVQLAADLVLCKLAQQGFRLTAWGEEQDAETLRTELVRDYGGTRVPPPDDLLRGCAP